MWQIRTKSPFKTCGACVQKIWDLHLGWENCARCQGWFACLSPQKCTENGGSGWGRVFQVLWIFFLASGISQAWGWKDLWYFSHSMGWFFTFLIMYFEAQELFILMKSDYFSLFAYSLGVSKKSLPHPRLRKLTPMFYSKSIRALALLIHF